MAERTSADIITENLNCIKTAREEFVKAESSEKIKRALNHNIRPSANTKFFSGDLVYYKRKDSRKWKGPGKVIGSDSSNILMKHGSNYVRVHSCRVLLEQRENGDKEHSEPVNTTARSVGVMTDDSGSTTDETEDSGEANDSEEDNLRERQSTEQVQEQRIESHRIRTSEDHNSPLEQNSDRSVGVNRLKKGAHIEFQLEDGTWETGKVVRRSGKATGMYKDYWYVQNLNNGEIEE